MKNKIFCLCTFILASTASALAQMKVSGTVVDDLGDPLMAATVLETGTGNGVVTDIDGKFTLTMQSNSNTLTISYVGYKKQTLKPSAMMNIQMEVDNVLEEMVVTGYQVQRKADLTGAVSVVQTKDLKTSSDSDPMRALQGKVAGMTITTDGSPSGTGTVRIRGIGSFNSSQDPLFVIDGVPTTASLNSLNMNDIESMQVLKDAASASIYGSRAANGVIIITTRKGKKGEKVKVDFSANLTSQFYTSQSTMDLCNSSEYATAMAQAALNDGIDPVAYASNYGLNLNATEGISIKAYDPKTGQYNNYTVNGLYDGYINNKKTMRFSDTDWIDAISRTGFSQSYDLSISNATEKSSALLSLGYKKNTGILKYTDFENFSGRVNTSFNINKYVSIGENMTVSYTNQVNSFPMENALKMAPTVPVYEEDNQTFAGPVGGMSDRQNPLRELYFNRDNRLKVWRIFGNAYIDIKPIKDLVIRSNFGIDYDQGFIHSVNYTFHSDIVNNDTPSTTLSEANDMKWTWSNTANYNFTLWDNHHFGALLGMEMYHQNRDEFSSYAELFDLETYKYMWPDAATGTERATGIANGYNLI